MQKLILKKFVLVNGIKTTAGYKKKRKTAAVTQFGQGHLPVQSWPSSTSSRRHAVTRRLLPWITDPRRQWEAGNHPLGPTKLCVSVSLWSDNVSGFHDPFGLLSFSASLGAMPAVFLLSPSPPALKLGGSLPAGLVRLPGVTGRDTVFGSGAELEFLCHQLCLCG